MPDACVDLIVTSPPYNLRNSTGSGMINSTEWSPLNEHGYADHDDKMQYDDYVEWQVSVLTECMRLIPDDGAIFYNHKWRVQGGLIQDRYDIVKHFPVRQIIIWQRAGGFNFNDHYFVPTYEVIYMIAKPKFRLLPKANALGDVWRIPQDFDNDHPAPFPIEVPSRIIQSVSAKTVLDPFVGSGTTAVAARMHGRDYIGIELSQEYVDMANARLAATGTAVGLF